MACCEVDHAHWACFAGSELRLKRFVIERDDALIQTVIQLVSEFRESVELGIIPEEFDPSDNEFLKRRFSRVDPISVTTNDDHLIAIARDYLEAKGAEKYAKDEQDRLQAELRAFVGEHSAAQIGPYLVKRTARHRNAYSVDATDYVEFRVTEPKGKK